MAHTLAPCGCQVRVSAGFVEENGGGPYCEVNSGVVITMF